jgi:hypothetical protein
MSKSAADRASKLETYWTRQKIMKSLQNFAETGEAADSEVQGALYAAALAGNVTAQMFWLKCRNPDKWNDHHKADQPTGDEADNLFEAIKAAISTKE